MSNISPFFRKKAKYEGMKVKTMAQWMNLQRNNRSVLAHCCEKNWAYPPSASGSYRREGVRQNTGGFQKFLILENLNAKQKHTGCKKSARPRRSSIVPYSLKFSRVKTFQDFCLTSKILISKILVLQGPLLKIIFCLIKMSCLSCRCINFLNASQCYQNPAVRYPESFHLQA